MLCFICTTEKHDNPQSYFLTQCPWEYPLGITYKRKLVAFFCQAGKKYSV